MIMRMFQVKQTVTYDLTTAAGTEQEAILKAKGIPHNSAQQGGRNRKDVVDAH